MIKNKHIDQGKGFDWGRTSLDYARYRDIYPPEFYQKIIDSGLCLKGQKVLDLGTGTGVLPRNLYSYGASFVGSDISENQIEQAVKISEAAGMKIDYLVSPAEKVSFTDNTFDVITACQCFFYFDHSILMPNLARMLKPDGKLAVMYMAWLPKESFVAQESEHLILKYNPVWSGAGETRHPIAIPKEIDDLFTIEEESVFDIPVPFTRESWNGRIKACRGVGASLADEEILAFEKDHLALLEQITPEKFTIPHYAAMLIMKVNK